MSLFDDALKSAVQSEKDAEAAYTFCGIVIKESAYVPEGFIVATDRRGHVVGIYNPKAGVWNPFPTRASIAKLTMTKATSDSLIAEGEKR